MAREIIALDIDGVLADWVSFGVPKLNNILGTKVSINDEISFEIHKVFGVSRKKMHWAYDKLYSEFSISDAKPVAGAQAAVNELAKTFELIAITARPKKFWRETEDWLNRYFDKEIIVHFGTGAGKPVGGEQHLDDKLTLCNKFNALYLVEDNPAEILSCLKTNTTPLCHAWPWNKSIESNKNVTRGDWEYLEKFINENEKKNISN